MKTITLLRYATLAALLAGALPAPASAQFGGLKRKLKEKIIQAAANDAAKKMAGDSAASTTAAPSATSGTAAPTGAPRAGKGTTGAAPAAAATTGSMFNEWVLEIKPDLLDRLERGLAAEAAVRKAAAEREKFRSPAEWDRCQQSELERVDKQFRAAAEAGNEQKATQLLTDFQTHKEERIEGKCGIDPREAPRRRSEAGVEAYRASTAAFGLGDRQYTILKERVAPFCSLTGTAEAAGAILRIPSGSAGKYLVYTPAEIETVKPRCAKLMPLFKATI